MKKNSSDRLGVLFVGMGSVATTLMAGVEAVKKGWGRPIGSLTQMGRLEKSGVPAGRMRDVLPLVPLDQLIFGGWDILPDNAYEAALHARVLDRSLLEKLKPRLATITPMKGVWDPYYLNAIQGTHIKKLKSKLDHVGAIRSDIRQFLRRNGCRRGAMVISSSTEIFHVGTAAHSAESFENQLRKKSPSISPTQLYTYAALLEGLPVVNATPNNWGSLPWLERVAASTGTPVAGSDLKSGQTMMKTIVAGGLRRRMLGVRGWFSTNILGNRDGLVLHDRGSFASKERSKKESLRALLSDQDYPDLYRDLVHLVDINYYPPKGDNKEGWDSIDLFGWLDYPMQIKINFLCRDSILAAPLVLDLVLLMDMAKRRGLSGPQSWLNFYFKSPIAPTGIRPSHDLTDQHRELQAELSRLLT